MFNLGKLFVAFEAKTKPYDDALAAAVRNARSSADAIGAATSFKPGADAAGAAAPPGMRDAAGQSQDAASQMRQAFAVALAPLNSIGARLGDQFNRVGGTVVALARKIDDSMRFQAAEAGAAKLKESIEAALKKAAATGVDSLTKIERATLKLGPAASKALNAYNGFSKLKSAVGSVFAGDIGRQSLDKVGKADFSQAVAGTMRLKGGLASIPGAANAATGSIKRLGSEIALAMGAFALVYKGVNFLKEGVMGAVDLNETVSKSRFVFGEASATIETAADEMAKKFRVPQQAFIDGAVSLGRYGKAAGKTQEEAAKLGIDLAKLGMDLMSQENIESAEEAFVKLRSALSGEVQVLRVHGAMLSEEAVNQEAVKMKLAATTSAVSEQAKVMARVSLIQQDLADVNGDLARTFDQPKNQMRAFGGSLKILGTEIGKALMPATETWERLLNQFSGSLLDTFESNKGTIQDFAQSLSSGFENVAAAFQGVREIAAQVPAAFDEAFGSGSVSGLIDTVKGGFELMGIALRNVPAFAEVAGLKIVEVFTNVGEYWSAVGGHIVDVAKYLAENWYQVIVDSFTATRTWITNWWTNIANLAKAGYEAMSGKGFHFEWKPLAEGFEAMAAKMPQMAEVGFTDFSKEIEGKLREIGEREAAYAESMVKKAKGKDPTSTYKARAGKKEEHKKDPEEYGFAEFARKLGSRQFQDKDKATVDNTKALAEHKTAVEKNTEALAKKSPAVFA